MEKLVIKLLKFLSCSAVVINLCHSHNSWRCKLTASHGAHSYLSVVYNSTATKDGYRHYILKEQVMIYKRKPFVGSHNALESHYTLILDKNTCRPTSPTLPPPHETTQ